MRDAVDGGNPDRGDLIRLAAATEVLLSVAERVDGEIADEAILADLYELRDHRRYTASAGVRKLTAPTELLDGNAGSGTRMRADVHPVIEA
jgi:hypothetical protein